MKYPQRDVRQYSINHLIDLNLIILQTGELKYVYLLVTYAFELMWTCNVASYINTACIQPVLFFLNFSIDSLHVNTCYKKLTFRQNRSMNYCHHITFFMHFSIVHVNILFNWEKKIFMQSHLTIFIIKSQRSIVGNIWILWKKNE